ncbi:hypothetical protein [Plantactinospora soyae]|uniref:Uncharacterized protein n=1 Tax=Plantactinospora soyae TaxID=1544732 RepID=A0A927M1C5_9ACTN|nr:hypothetical protein [Plantactinospora soyae]MBE1486307.1 hypothetical protein [Plantactinospora soyae]
MPLVIGGIGQEMCRTIIRAGVDLSVGQHIGWRVTDGAERRSLATLSRELHSCHSDGRNFDLPESVQDVFGLRFDIADTAYPLAILYLWILGSLDDQIGPARERNAANALVWQLSRLAPDLPYREFQELRRALDRAAGVDVET